MGIVSDWMLLISMVGVGDTVESLTSIEVFNDNAIAAFSFII